MSFVHTAFGEGQIVGEETVRGRKQYLVAGSGFKIWIDEADAQIHTGAAEFPYEPAENVNEDNSTDLPYDPSPQFPVEGFSDEQTIQPNHEIDADERLSPADSLDFDSVGDREYPAPAAHLFAHRTAEISERDEPGICPCGQHYVTPGFTHRDWEDWARNAEQENFVDDPEAGFDKLIQGATGRDRYRDKAYSESRDRGRAEHEHQDLEEFPLGPGYDRPGFGHDDIAEYEDYLDRHDYRHAGLSDKYIDITADVDHFNDPVQRFRDDPIREINRLGHILSDVHDDDRMEHYASLVDSDPIMREAAWSDVRQKAQRIRREGKLDIHDIDNNQIYATVHGDHGDYDVMIVKGGLGGQSITQWTCSCDWGRHAFKRKVLHVGRLCSHGLAGWLEMQSHELSDVAQKHPYKKRADVVDDYKSYNDENNDGHVDKATADNFISRPHQAGGIEPMGPEDVDKIYNYVEDNKSQPGERNYDLPYTLDPDKAYKSAEVLRTQPHSLTPDLKFVPEGEDSHFVDVEEDERETTGPDQIVHFGSRRKAYEDEPSASTLHGPAALGRYRRYCDENDLDELEPQSLDWYIEDHAPNDDAIKRIKDFHWINGLPGDPDLRNSSRTAGYEDDIDGGWDRYVTERLAPKTIGQDGVHEFDSTGQAYDECMCNEDIHDGDIIHIPSEGVVGLAGTWPAAVTKQIGNLHAFNDEIHSNPDLIQQDGNDEWTGDHIRKALEFAQQHGYETGPYVKEGRRRHAGEEVNPEPYRDFDGGGELLDELREESSTPLEEDFGNMRDRNDDVREIVEELREKGYDADQFVASRRHAGEEKGRGWAYQRTPQDRFGDSDEEWEAYNRAVDRAVDQADDENRRRRHESSYGLRPGEGGRCDTMMCKNIAQRGKDGKTYCEDCRQRKSEERKREGSYGVGNQGAGPGGAFGQPGGGNWADQAFAGSGPDPKFWYESSEDYVDAHEKPRYEDVTDLGDDDIIKYTEAPPQGPGKKSRKMGWLDSPSPPDAYDTPEDCVVCGKNLDLENVTGVCGKRCQRELDEDNRRFDEGMAQSYEQSLADEEELKHLGSVDPIEKFYKSGAADAIKSGGSSSGGGSFSDDSIAERANQFLMRTAGRNYSLSEQRELEDEEHHLGARNLDGLDLTGTHYLS